MFSVLEIDGFSIPIYNPVVRIILVLGGLYLWFYHNDLQQEIPFSWKLSLLHIFFHERQNIFPNQFFWFLNRMAHVRLAKQISELIFTVRLWTLKSVQYLITFNVAVFTPNNQTVKIFTPYNDVWNDVSKITFCFLKM